MSTVPENFSDSDRAMFSPTPPTSPPSVTSPGGTGQVLSNLTLMTFAEAMDIVLQGGVVRRLEWKEPEVIVKIIDEKLVILLAEDRPYDYLIVSRGDLLGEDWVRVSEE